MKFLVLGGAGYVGSHFVYRATDLGHSVCVYDSCERGHKEYLPTSATLVIGNILDIAALAKTISEFKPDTILHYAAYALVPESVTNPFMYYKNNVSGVISVFEAMITAKHHCPLVFSSTCAVFGTPKQLPITEESPKSPESTYGMTKLQAEQIIADCAKQLGIPAMALRYFNACGADEQARTGEAHEPETHLIPNIIKAAVAHKPVTIFGKDYPTKDGTCVRDYIHVTDLADAHIAAAQLMAQHKTMGFEAVLLGTGVGKSNLEIVHATEKVIGHKIDVVFADRRPGDAAGLYADPTKAKNLLGFKPKYSDLETIVASAYRWYTRAS